MSIIYKLTLDNLLGNDGLRPALAGSPKFTSNATGFSTKKKYLQRQMSVPVLEIQE
jgi:hypothetical protein